MSRLSKRDLGQYRCPQCNTWHEHFRLTPAGLLELKCELCEQWHPHAHIARMDVPAGWGVLIVDERRKSTLERRTDGASRIGDGFARKRFPRTKEVQACYGCRYAADVPVAVGTLSSVTDMTPRLVKHPK